MKCVGCCSSGLLPAEIINPCCNIMDNIISNQLQWHGDNLEFGQEEVISLARGSPYCKGGFLSVNIKTYLSVSHTYKSLSVCCCTEMYFRLSGGWNWLFQSEATLEEKKNFHTCWHIFKFDLRLIQIPAKVSVRQNLTQRFNTTFYDEYNKWKHMDRCDDSEGFNLWNNHNC